MKFPLTRWLRGRGEQEGGPLPRNPDDGVIEHLAAGRSLKPGRRGEMVSMVLKGRCESEEERRELAPGDAVGAVGRTIRALADSTILRIPRNTLQKLVPRWQGLTRWAEPRLEVVGPNGEKSGGRIVCLAPLSEEVPCGELAMGLARAIFDETGASVLVLRIKGERPKNRGLDRVDEAIFRQEAAFGEGPKGLDALAQTLDGRVKEFAYVIVEVGRDATVEILDGVMRRSWATYSVLRQTGASLFELNLFLRETRVKGLDATRVKPVVYLDPGESAHGLSRYVEDASGRAVHRFVRGGPDSALWSAGVRRWGREICERQVGLVLSSGAARGLSHIGVIQVFEENNIEIDVVAGSSIGAYIGAVWGAGHGGHELEEFARELEGYRGLWGLMDMAILPQRGFLLTARVRKRLEKTIGELHFSDLTRPVRVVATRLDTLERVVFSGGNVVDAVLASVSIPGICVPVTLDGVAYIDGGICDPLPVDVLTDMGIRKIIAVNTIATPATLRACGDDTRNGPRVRPVWRRAFDATLNPFARGNVFDTLMRSIHAAQTRMAETSSRNASIVVRPFSCEGRWHDFGNPLRYISQGREAAQAKLPAIKKLIAASHYETSPPHQLLEQVA